MSDPAVGLCSTCRHSRIVPGGRSTFYMCQRSFTEPEYPKYPRLPVVACRGYAGPEARQENAANADKLKK
jgi:hypothetical protein